MEMITHGNLFSGSGTWELAAQICGIKTMWEAEIEPFPVAVEAARFPDAVQLGDVSKISGADIPVVDIMTNSSPCQDLSVAGKRAGLDGERSGLFDQAIRICKEMRDAQKRLHSVWTDDDLRLLRPRFWCWENVPGAFSSNNGEDFRIVLESVARMVEEDAVIPVPPKGWSYSGVVDLERGQIAWRTMDAQFYGVPQRRRRIFLVADLGGHSAGEILFEREGVSWHHSEIASAWQNTSYCLTYRINQAGEYVRGRISKPFSREVECWLPCAGYEGLYEVSDRGRVRNVKGEIRALHLNKGYQNVSLHKNGTQKTEKVHRLVAKTFLLNLNNYDQINHIDENRENNCAWNLEWCDSAYNANYGSRSEKNAKAHEKPVIATDADGNERFYDSQTKAARELNGSAGTINQALNGLIESAYGFTWRYAEKKLICPLTWDARGNGDGLKTCTIVGGHQDRVTDYTAIVLS